MLRDGQAGRLATRYYSVASGPSTSDSMVSFAFSVVDYPVPERAATGAPVPHPEWFSRVSRRGLCTDWIERSAVDSTTSKALDFAVPVYLRPTSDGFHLPASHATPMVMVGPGTGVAPFLGFLAERAMADDGRDSSVGSRLYFGCRNRSQGCWGVRG